jgi:organic hydroperoxide reductase OsmC/OhrA
LCNNPTNHAGEAILLNEESIRTFRVYSAWQGLTVNEGELSSSFSNLRLTFSAPVADGGQPGLTTPEELLLGAAVTAYCTTFMNLAEQMVIDIASLTVEGELIRAFDEIDGHVIKEIRLTPDARLRTGIGFEKVHDMFRRAASLTQHKSPVLKALAGAVRLRIEPSFGEAR